MFGQPSRTRTFPTRLMVSMFMQLGQQRQILAHGSFSRSLSPLCCVSLCHYDKHNDQNSLGEAQVCVWLIQFTLSWMEFGTITQEGTEGKACVIYHTALPLTQELTHSQRSPVATSGGCCLLVHRLTAKVKNTCLGNGATHCGLNHLHRLITKTMPLRRI